MSENDVLVVGFPKSGNSYLSRLLGDVLDSPVTGWGTAHPLAEEGKDRTGKYVVRQLHLKPVDTPMTPNYTAWEYSVPSANGEKIAFIQRNPLDVIVSAYHYWNMESMDKAIEAVLFGKHPLQKVGAWEKFSNLWGEALLKLDVSYYLEYQWLLEDTQQSLIELMGFIGIDYDVQRLAPAIERQSFDNRKKELEHSGDKYNYGATIQTSNLRHGRVGDWKTELTPEQVAFVKDNLSRNVATFYDF